MALPEIINNYLSSCNPYRVSQAKGLLLDAKGVFLPFGNKQLKTVNIKLDAQSPLPYFQAQVSWPFHQFYFGRDKSHGFVQFKKFGFKQYEAKNENELFDSCTGFYLSLLPLMPWVFASMETHYKEISPNTVEMALSDSPVNTIQLEFNESGRIIAAELHPKIYFLHSEIGGKITVEYGRYNIKKGYKLPTELKYRSSQNPFQFFLEINKITGYSIL
jgi:hypothetical protein